MLWCI